MTNSLPETILSNEDLDAIRDRTLQQISNREKITYGRSHRKLSPMEKIEGDRE